MSGAQLEERGELFVLIGKSNRSDLSRKFWHRSSKLLTQRKNTIYADSPLACLYIVETPGGCWEFRLSSGLPTDMVSQATKSQSVGTFGRSRDFRHPKMRRWAAAKSTSVGTSGTKHRDFRLPKVHKLCPSVREVILSLFWFYFYA